MASGDRTVKRLNSNARWWAAGGAILIAGMMTASPASARLSPGLTIKAPYHHAVITPFSGDLTDVGGCASAKTTKPVLNPTTGYGAWMGTAIATNCPGKVGSTIPSSSLLQYGSEVALPIKSPHGTAVPIWVNVTWQINITMGDSGRYTLPGGGCPAHLVLPYNYTLADCVGGVINQVIGGASVEDLTNGTEYQSASSPSFPFVYNETQSYGYNCNPTCTWSNSSLIYGSPTHNGTFTGTFSIPLIANGLHRYVVVTYIGGDIVAYMSGYTGHVKGFINMATGGNNYQLVSVTET